MMNKRSSRLIAWLLAMVMILNIVPVTGFADQSGSIKSEEKANPANVSIVYDAGTEAHFGNNAREKEKTGAELSPSESELTLYNSYFRLAGWSTVNNYDGKNGYLVEPGTSVDLNKVTFQDGKTRLYAIGKKSVIFLLSSYTS